MRGGELVKLFRERGSLIQEEERVIKGLLGEGALSSLRKLYPARIDAKKLRAMGIAFILLPEEIFSNLLGLTMLGLSAVADKLNPFGLDNIKREFTVLLEDLDNE